uniref:Uncharacterized protein n=1 Tax=Panagrellus redivivus TaxID=6233 RepID=A0A7E4VI30_PANRE
MHPTCYAFNAVLVHQAMPTTKPHCLEIEAWQDCDILKVISHPGGSVFIKVEIKRLQFPKSFQHPASGAKRES